MRQLGLQDGNAAARLNQLFGMKETEGEHIRSAIRFGETVIDGGQPYSLTRNAVDRFTQAPKKWLFSQQGSGREEEEPLEISIERDKLDKLQAQLLAVSLIDLDLGLLSFGGQQEQDTGDAV